MSENASEPKASSLKCLCNAPEPKDVRFIWMIQTRNIRNSNILYIYRSWTHEMFGICA